MYLHTLFLVLLRMFSSETKESSETEESRETGEGVTPESRSLDIEPPWASRAALQTEGEVGSPVKQVSGE